MFSTMSRRLLVFCTALAVWAVFGPAQTVFAVIDIPTNTGSGADAELREFETNIFVDPIDVGNPLNGLVQGGNRGGGNELATRHSDSVTQGAANPTPPPANLISNYYPTGDRSSIMYMKFDISGLPAWNSSWWDDRNVNLRMFIRNNNQSGGADLWSRVPQSVDNTVLADYRLMQFAIKALDPEGTYSTARTDRFGNAYTASYYDYDWTEGTGNSGSDQTGITFYNAPGIRPHCVFAGQGLCDASALDPGDPLYDPNSNDSAVQTLGLYDDFDENVQTIDDEWHWPNEATAATYTTTTGAPTNLVAGHPLDYEDPNGDLKALVLKALEVGETTVTLMVHHGYDGTVNQPNVGIVGTTPNGWLGGQNYLAVPKEGGATAPLNGLDNSGGAYSPRLLIFVPEPASIAMLAMGLLSALAIFRKRK